MMRRLLRLQALAFVLLAAGCSAVQPADRRPAFVIAAPKALSNSCTAVLGTNDRVAGRASERAWSVQCEGIRGAVGELFLLDADAAKPDGAWRASLGERRGRAGSRADCSSADPVTLKGAATAQASRCSISDTALQFVLLSAPKGRRVVAAEGLPRFQPVLEQGLRLLLGVESPPRTESPEKVMLIAKRDSERSASLRGAAQDSVGLVRLDQLTETGYRSNWEWSFADAEQEFRAVLQQAESLGRGDDIAEALLNVGLNASNQGKYADADTAFIKAGQLLARSSNSLLRMKLLVYQALHARNQRSFAEAIRLAQDALRQTGASANSADTLAAGEESAAADPSQLASASDGSVVISPAIANRLNRVQVASAKPGAAVSSAILEQTGASQADVRAVQRAQAYMVIGTSQRALKDAGAQRTLELARAEYEKISDPRIEPWLRVRIVAEQARFDEDRGDIPGAISRLTAALEGVRRFQSGSAQEAALLLDRGRIRARSGDTTPALDDYEAGLQILARESNSSVSDAALEPYVATLMKQVAGNNGANSEAMERLFRTTQTKRGATAATFASLSARLREGSGPLERLMRQRDEQERLVRKTRYQLAAAQDAQDTAQAEALAKAVEEQEAEQARLDARLNNDFPGQYAGTLLSRATVADLQKALQPNEAYVRYFFIRTSGIGIVIRRDRVMAFPITRSRARLAQSVLDLREAFDRTEGGQSVVLAYDVPEAYALYRDLLGPAEAMLEGANHLIVEPDTEMASLPLGILVTSQKSVDAFLAAAKRFNSFMSERRKAGAVPEAERQKARAELFDSVYSQLDWVASRFAITQAVDGASFLGFRNARASSADKTMIGFGDFTEFNLAEALAATGVPTAALCENVSIPALPGTRTELERVSASLGAGKSTVFYGDAFTDEVVKDSDTKLNNYRIVYFATHGLLPGELTCLTEPALVTSRAKDSAGLLKMSDIVKLRLDADLVVLSACNTGGQGGAGVAAEGLQGGAAALDGLVQAFGIAGAHSIMLTHWKANDAATALLMGRLFASPQGSSISEALRQAQLSVIHETGYGHPRFWGPFSLVGDGAKALPR